MLLLLVKLVKSLVILIIIGLFIVHISSSFPGPSIVVHVGVIAVVLTKSLPIHGFPAMQTWLGRHATSSALHLVLIVSLALVLVLVLVELTWRGASATATAHVVEIAVGAAA